MTIPYDMTDINRIADKLLKAKAECIKCVPMTQSEIDWCNAMHVANLPTRHEIVREMTVSALGCIGRVVLFCAFWWWLSRLLDCIYCCMHGLGC